MVTALMVLRGLLGLLMARDVRKVPISSLDELAEEGGGGFVGWEGIGRI